MQRMLLDPERVRRRAEAEAKLAGTQFTRFTGTKEHIPTRSLQARSLPTLLVQKNTY